MGSPRTPYQPYAHVHTLDNDKGEDLRPTALQVVRDNDAIGKLEGRKVLVTGASSGLGMATAAALYETGAHLLLTARNVSSLEKVIDDIISHSPSKDNHFPRPEPIAIHLDSLASVRAGAEQVKAKTKTLHCLINNAGVMATPEGRTEDGFETQMGINHFAHFALFRELNELLISGAKESGATSRVITVSSSSHMTSGIRFHDLDFSKAGYDKGLSYGQSKTANIYMANSITRRYGSQGVIGLSLHPGVMVTSSLGRHLSEEEIGGIANSIDVTKVKSMEQGAATPVWAALSPHFEDIAHGGRYLSDVGEAGPLAGNALADAPGYAAHAYNEAKEDMLWKLSCNAIGAPFD